MTTIYLSGEDLRFCKRWVNQYSAHPSGGSSKPPLSYFLRYIFLYENMPVQVQKIFEEIEGKLRQPLPCRGKI
jgi:hypothetical protein